MWVRQDFRETKYLNMLALHLPHYKSADAAAVVIISLKYYNFNC